MSQPRGAMEVPARQMGNLPCMFGPSFSILAASLTKTLF